MPEVLPAIRVFQGDESRAEFAVACDFRTPKLPPPVPRQGVIRAVCFPMVAMT